MHACDQRRPGKIIANNPVELSCYALDQRVTRGVAVKVVGAINADELNQRNGERRRHSSITTSPEIGKDGLKPR